LYYAAQPTFNFYKKSLGLDQYTVIEGSSSRDDWTIYKEDVDKLKKNQWVWFIFAHVSGTSPTENEETMIIDEVDKRGVCYGEIVSVGASGYLYNIVK